MTTRPKICKNRHYQRKRGVLFIHGFIGRVTGGLGNMGIRRTQQRAGYFKMEHGEHRPLDFFFLLSLSKPALQAGIHISLSRRDNLGWDDEDTIVNQQIFSNHIT
ncbi:hypothetical protein K456DRAFT_264378 [Colletotrichum gloeosporioides 23]|nr:hypothetical protein K456DRAFT_264378 [Colletotrichum gloeosporioides 23]